MSHVNSCVFQHSQSSQFQAITDHDHVDFVLQGFAALVYLIFLTRAEIVFILKSTAVEEVVDLSQMACALNVLAGSLQTGYKTWNEHQEASLATDQGIDSFASAGPCGRRHRNMFGCQGNGSRLLERLSQHVPESRRLGET